MFLAAVLVVGFLPVTAEGQNDEGSFSELGIGDWEGVASIFGTTTAGGSGVTIAIFGVFDVWLEFVVPTEGLVTGPWDLVGFTDWQMSGTTVSLEHAAQGELHGDRTRLTMGASQITSTGQVTVGSEVISISSADPLGPFDLTVSGIWCERAWGEWALSWNIDLQDAGLTPTFLGDWWAIRIPEDEASAESVQLLAKKFEALGTRIRNVVDWSGEIDGVPIVPYGTLGNLLIEAAHLDNELANLSLCDRSYLGDARVEEWRSTLSGLIAVVAQALFGNLELNGDTLPGDQLLKLAYVLAGANVIGEGTLVDPETAAAIKQGLQDQVDQILGDPHADRSDLVNAVATADSFGLEIPDDFDRSRVEAS